MKDYMEGVKDLKAEMAEQFSQADRHNYTKSMVERLRLGRGITSPVDGAGDEYGNYKKFEEGKNSVKQVNDPGLNDVGEEQFQLNVRKMFEEMDTPYRD